MGADGGSAAGHGTLQRPHEPGVDRDVLGLRGRLDGRLQRLRQAQRDPRREGVVAGNRLRRLLLDVDELRILTGQPDLDVAVRQLAGNIERDLCERVDQPQRGGLLDGAGEALRRLDELLASDLGQLAKIGLERLDELWHLHGGTMTSLLMSVKRQLDTWPTLA